MAPSSGFRAVTSILELGTELHTGGGWDLSEYEDIGFVSKWNGTEWSDLLSECCGPVNILAIGYRYLRRRRSIGRRCQMERFELARHWIR